MNKTIAILIIIFIIVLGLSPFFMTQNALDRISVSSNIISVCASLITLLIALLLYSKYGVEKSVISKQTEVVLRLLTELKRTRFLISSGNGVMLFLHLDMLDQGYLKEYENKNLAFNRSYPYGLERIWEIAEEIFLPIEIMSKVKPLLVQSITSVVEKERYLVVSVPEYHDETIDVFFGKLNNEEITLKEFIHRWSSLINETKKWLKVRSNMKVDINFDRL